MSIPEAGATQVARHIISTFLECGIRTFILCPGSRSAPFAYALYDAEQAGAITLHIETDERVAAFVALGCGLAGTPAVCVTTSGSAVANLYPAVQESYHSCVPMILLSADRPWELHGCRANQTTDQSSLFRGSIRYFLDIPAGSRADMAMAGHVKRSVRAAMGIGFENVPGPVHINCALRPPLIPDSTWSACDIHSHNAHFWKFHGIQRRSSKEKNAGQAVTESCFISESAHGTELNDSAPRTVVVGASSTLDVQSYSPALYQALEQVPIFAEPTSLLRSLPSSICGYTYALHTSLRSSIERVILIGHPTLTREISTLLNDEHVSVYVVDEPPTYADSTGTAHVISLDELPDYLRTPRAYMDLWLRASEAARRSIVAIVDAEPELSWVHIAHALSIHSPMPMHIGASSIIRELNTYGDGFSCTATANRGLAGIDGTISTARGLSLAYGKPVRVCLGDLSFVYDMSALVPVDGQNDTCVDVVCIDDGGGSLFSTLEYGQKYFSAFDRVFRTRRNVDMHAYAQACGASYVRVCNYEELVQTLDQSITVNNRIIHICMGEYSAVQMRHQRERHAEILIQAINDSL